MPIRVRPNPRKKILKLVNERAGITRTEVAKALGISYWSARYWLEKLVTEAFLKKKEFWVGRAIRRIEYEVVVVAVLYRTQFAMLFYVEKPRTKSPDPIAEFRVTAVSNVRGKYDLGQFERACIYIGVILAPWTYWIKQKFMITADEKDEAIDPDELSYSVPVFGRLNFAERYAVFFRSRRKEEDYWRDEHPYYWLDPEAPVPYPRKGDYEYDEKVIKTEEEKAIALKRLKMRFNNILGEMESVTE